MKDKYYQISHGECLKLLLPPGNRHGTSGSIEFSKYEIDYLHKMNYTFNRSHHNSIEFTFHDNNNRHMDCILYKIEDEWFLVESFDEIEYKYYKCDQFDGLISWIESLRRLKNIKTY